MSCLRGFRLYKALVRAMDILSRGNGPHVSANRRRRLCNGDHSNSEFHQLYSGLVTDVKVNIGMGIRLRRMELKSRWNNIS